MIWNYFWQKLFQDVPFDLCGDKEERERSHYKTIKKLNLHVLCAVFAKSLKKAQRSKLEMKKLHYNPHIFSLSLSFLIYITKGVIPPPEFLEL